MRCTHLLLVAALAGCGKSDKPAPSSTPAPTGSQAAPTPPADPPPSEPKTIKACDLISEADATTALGTPTKYRSKDDTETCVLDPVKDSPPEGDSIDFSAKADGGSMFTYLEKSMKAAKKIEGVGEKAILEGTEEGMVRFAVVKNGKTVHGAAMQPGPKRPGFLARVEAVMKKLAEKM
jgi:hypothetical protein